MSLGQLVSQKRHCHIAGEVDQIKGLYHCKGPCEKNLQKRVNPPSVSSTPSSKKWSQLRGLGTHSFDADAKCPLKDCHVLLQSSKSKFGRTSSICCKGRLHLCLTELLGQGTNAVDHLRHGNVVERQRDLLIVRAKPTMRSEVQKIHQVP